MNFFELVFDCEEEVHSFFLSHEQLDISKLLPFVSRKNRIKTRALAVFLEGAQGVCAVSRLCEPTNL